MKRRIFRLVCLVGVLCIVGGCGEKTAPNSDLSGSGDSGGVESVHPREGWLENYEEALAEAKGSGRAVLVDFTGSDWCGPCIQMDKEIFSTDVFKDWAKEAVVLLELDFPSKRKLSAELKKQNDALAVKYGISGYPTVMLMDGDGKVLGQMTGYSSVSAEAWIKSVDGALGR